MMMYRLVSAEDCKTILFKGTHDACYNAQHLYRDFGIYTHIEQD